MNISNYICGRDSIDICKLAKIDMWRAPIRHDDPNDVGPEVAEQLIAAGADVEEFYLDLERLDPEESAEVIHALLGLWKMVPDGTALAID